MDMECILGRMEIDMKVNGKTVSSMDKALIFLQMEIHLMVHIKWGNLMVTDNINGKMEVSILESSKMDSKMVKANGRKHKTLKIAMHMMVSTFKIKRMGMVFFNGKVETYTRALTRMTREKVTERCIGSMAQFIKENGNVVSNTAWGKCSFQMVQLKKATLKTMYIKEEKILKQIWVQWEY
jgi:hypothetical protein